MSSPVSGHLLTPSKESLGNSMAGGNLDGALLPPAPDHVRRQVNTRLAVRRHPMSEQVVEDSYGNQGDLNRAVGDRSGPVGTRPSSRCANVEPAVSTEDRAVTRTPVPALCAPCWRRATLTPTRFAADEVIDIDHASIVQDFDNQLITLA